MSSVDRTIVTAAAIAPVSLIQDLVARHFAISRADMLSGRRQTELTHPRQIAMWLACRLTTLGIHGIGRQFGRHHTTVIHGRDVVDARRAADPVLASAIDGLELSIRSMAQGSRIPIPPELDPLAIAQRVVIGGARSAMALSTVEVVAVCLRLEALEEVCAGTAALLGRLDRLNEASDDAEREALVLSSKALIATVAGTLEELGYQQESNHGQDQQQAEAGTASADVHAAAAAE